VVASPVLRVVGFAVFTLALLIALWRTLGKGWTHAVPRLAAFEAILGLVFVNAPTWFVAPFILRQVCSWTLLVASLLLALHGFRLLSAEGAPMRGIESTTTVVRRGAYRYIRHPLYLSLMLFAAGTFLKGPGVVTCGLLLLAIGGLALTALAEERENLERFGEAYRDYMRATKRFIPFLL
jgi:protein-S-isoprenylcysteine O-methyltransferase Ste14